MKTNPLAGKTCAKSTMYGYQSYPCGKPAKVVRKGVGYCGLHDPEKPLTQSQRLAVVNREIYLTNMDLSEAMKEAGKAFVSMFPDDPISTNFQKIKSKIATLTQQATEIQNETRTVREK